MDSLFTRGRAVSAVYRKKISKTWKTVHLFNYLAFYMVSIHALLIGTDFSSTGIKLLSIVMMIIVAGVFIDKHLKKSILKI
ncbi:hypothetical protein [Methanohalobium sp.]|uniref:hypothetical protein n=1 Tax=Methanohalobium sp. TaxID=2837493 RepID=UPI0025F619B7|nr:hypothetical protein [Methanohalobium sp.]